MRSIYCVYHVDHLDGMFVPPVSNSFEKCSCSMCSWGGGSSKGPGSLPWCGIWLCVGSALLEWLLLISSLVPHVKRLPPSRFITLRTSSRFVSFADVVSVCNLADVVSLCKYYFKRILHVFFSSATIVNTGDVVRDQRSEAAPIASSYVYFVQCYRRGIFLP